MAPDISEAAPPPPRDPALRDFLSTFLQDDDPNTLATFLEISTLNGCVASCTANRPAFLKRLATYGIAKLATRQKIANALSKAVRVGTAPKPSVSDLLDTIGREDGTSDSTSGELLHAVAPLDVAAQSPPPPNAAKGLLIPRLIFQTNKTRKVGAAAWRNTCAIMDLHPHYSYRFYDDARCAQLVAEHFAPCVLAAFQSLRAGAAKADLFRYCALYVHGGVYLDLDASIIGPLDCPNEAGEKPLLSAGDEHAFMYDAEANLIQWVLIAMPKHPVILRTIELSVARILQREPNIFVATGPSVFTDAFLSLKRGGSSRSSSSTSSVYASRTSMRWGERIHFLQMHGAIGECAATVRATYDGYTHEDVYVGGAQERYLPTWGAEPTKGLYHPLPRDMLIPRMPPRTAAQLEAGGAVPSCVPTTPDVLSRWYVWSGSDVLRADEEGAGARLEWRIELELGCAKSGPLPPERASVLLPPAAEAAAEGEGAKGGGASAAGPAPGAPDVDAPWTIPHAPARLAFTFERTAAAGAEEDDEGSGRVRVYSQLHGLWRRSPGQPQQLHLFDWRVLGYAQDDGWDSLDHTEAPSVLQVVDNARLALEGWEGDGMAEESLARRLCVARRARAAAEGATDEGSLQLPIVFH